MSKKITKWSELKVGDLVECRADGVIRTLLVCEKIEADKKATTYNAWHSPLRLAVLYWGNERYTLFESDLMSGDGVKLVWEGKQLVNRLKDLEVL